MSQHSNVAGTPGLDSRLPNVKLHIGGKERHLCFDLNAVCVVEALTGLNLFECAVGSVNATNIRALLYASLLHDDPTLTLEQVGSWVNPRNVVGVKLAIWDAWFASNEAEEKDPQGEAQAQA